MGEKGYILVLVVIVVVAMMGLLLYKEIVNSNMAGFCEAKGYDGYQWIEDKLCCYRGEDGSFVAVPVSVLKGE